MAEKATIGGIPIECLTGEPAAIWSGWRSLGDRELVREASAKGTHITLAYKCLANRRNTSIEDALYYFHKEVEIWIMELLKKHQIFRASHILKNVGKDSVEYIFDVCMKTKDVTLRNYLIEYLTNVTRFENEHKESWDLIQNVTRFEEKYGIQDGFSSSVCIEDILKLSENVKEAICTELYFSIKEENMSKYITNNILWNYLLSNNEINKIKFWIDTHYNTNGVKELNDSNKKYSSLFHNLSITTDMIESIDSSNASFLVQDLTKNHLCRYGVFIRKEQQDIKLILSRIFSNATTPKELETIISRKSCNLEETEFFRKIDKAVCLAHCLHERETQEINLEVTNLFEVLQIMCEYQDQYPNTFIQAIFKTIHYIAEDTNSFFQKNYLIVVALIFLHLYIKENMNNENKASEINQGNLREIFKNEAKLNFGVYDISNEILKNTFKKVPHLERIIENKTEQDEITMYELLDGYKNLNVKQLFKWRMKNEAMPHFSNESLVKKYGYTEALTYGYYLKEARPNMAINNLIQAQGKLLRSISSRRKSKASFYAHILALRNLDKPEILCSSISFIEMLGVDSENLRLHITAANYVSKKINVSIGDLLESVMYRNEKDLQSVMSYLEKSFQKNLNNCFIENSQQFVNALKTWDVVVRFARVHNSLLPDSLLKFLANQNYWVEFILVCHIFAYPLNQVLANVKEFEDRELKEHLWACLNNRQLTKSYSTLNEHKIKSRNARQSPYCNLGVKQSDSPTSCSSVSADTSSSDSYVSTCEFSPINDNIYSLTDDLWLTILKCQQSPDPPGALINASISILRPILTILATCYEPSSTAAYCYTWMLISVADENILPDYKECLEHQLWSANKVFDLLDGMVSRDYISTLNKAYKIFMPESPFDPFFEFLEECVNRGDFKGCQQNLLQFKSRCLTLKCNKIMDWDIYDTTYLKNLYWIAVVAVKCVMTTLAYNLRSTHLQVKFLKVLTKCNFHVDLPVQVPDFQCLLQITKILQGTNIMFDFAAVNLSNNTYNFEAEIQRCIDALLNNADYNSALELSNATDMNLSEIILAQCRNKFKHSIEKNNSVESEFWNECAWSFEKYKVSCEKAAEFFVEHAEAVVSHKERYEVLKLAFETLKNVSSERRTIDTLEMAMWKSCILAGPENIQLDSSNYIFNKLKTELLSGLNELLVSCALTDPDEKNAAEVLINKLIDSGKLDVALRIRTIFNFKHKDLEILMLCLSLAEGEIVPSELTAEQKSLLTETNKNKQSKYGALKNRGLQRFSSTSSINTTTSGGETSKMKDESVHKFQMECLSILERALEVLQHGVDVCLRVVLCYKLSVRLGRNYELLLIRDNSIQFLQEITENNIDNKCEICSDIIAAYKISNDKVAMFLAENITANVTRAIEGGFEDYICLWGYPLNTSFHIIMELCSDVSILGWQLLKTANKLLGRPQVSTLKTTVELLIRSHDCFTASCNMEGIASVLRKCQSLANTLQNLKYWTLMVRLVTGVGRFTEMNYVFQILKENDHFEFLLGKGLDKVTGLKTALLEFLKRYCLENKELFTLVSLHFRLYKEIALMWENEAKDVIKKLISDASKDYGKIQSSAPQAVKLSKTDNVQKQLQLAVTYYTHATQYYLQDNKLNLASRCSDQTQLVSLQLSLFTSSSNQEVVCILNLKTEEVDRILCHILNFSQALTVMHAYNHHMDWANLIYNHCILNGEVKYLKDFTAVNKLTASLVQDCARRYRLEKNINQAMTDNMKTLISELSDVDCKYMLASQLGFKNIVETILNNPIISAYLKDTVWKKGYSAL